MSRTVARTLVAGVVATAALALTGGAASAAEQDGDVPVWLVPGVDLGGLVSPVIDLPAQGLAPVYDLITLVAG